MTLLLHNLQETIHGNINAGDKWQQKCHLLNGFLSVGKRNNSLTILSNKQTVYCTWQQ